MAVLLDRDSLLQRKGRHLHDIYFDTITPTSNGLIEFTRNGVPYTERVTAKGLIKAAGNADYYIEIKDGEINGQSVTIIETGESENVPLFIRNADSNMVAVIPPGETTELKWFFTSATAGTWTLPNQNHAPTRTYRFNDNPAIGETIEATGGTIAATADGAVNGHHYPDGLTLYVRHDVGAAYMLLLLLQM